MYVYDKPGFGSQVGAALGQGLQQLVDVKMQQMLKERERTQKVQGLQALKDLSGKPLFTPEEAQYGASLDPQLLREVTKQRMLQPGREAEFNAYANIPPVPIDQTPITQTSTSTFPTEGTSAQAPGEQVTPTMPPQPQTTPSTPTAPAAMPALSPEIIARARAMGPKGTEYLKFEREQQLKQQLALQKAATQEKLVEKKFQLGRKGKLLDTVEKELDAQLKHKQAGQEILDAVSTQRMLAKTGKLDSVAWTTGVNSLENLTGLSLKGLLLTPESRAYLGIQKTYLAPLKDIFGSRPTQFDVQQFLMSLPQLENTPEGQEMLFQINERIANAKVEKANLYQKTYDEFIDKNLDFKNFNRVFQKRWDERGKELFDQFTKEFVGAPKLQIPKDLKPTSVSGKGIRIQDTDYLIDDNRSLLTKEEYLAKHPNWRP